MKKMRVSGHERPLRLFEVLARNRQSAVDLFGRSICAREQSTRMFTIPSRQQLSSPTRLAIRARRVIHSRTRIRRIRVIYTTSTNTHTQLKETKIFPHNKSDSFLCFKMTTLSPSLSPPFASHATKKNRNTKNTTERRRSTILSSNTRCSSSSSLRLRRRKAMRTTTTVSSSESESPIIMNKDDDYDEKTASSDDDNGDYHHRRWVSWLSGSCAVGNKKRAVRFIRILGRIWRSSENGYRRRVHLRPRVCHLSLLVRRM